MKKALSIFMSVALCLAAAIGLSGTALAKGSLFSNDLVVQWRLAPKSSFVFYVTEPNTYISNVSINVGNSYNLGDDLARAKNLTMQIAQYSYTDLNQSFPKNPQTVISTSKVTVTAPDGGDLTALASANGSSQLLLTGNFGVTLGLGTYRVELTPESEVDKLINYGYGVDFDGTGAVQQVSEATGEDIITFCLGIGCSFQEAKDLYRYYMYEWQQEMDRLIAEANARKKEADAKRAAEYAKKPISLQVNGRSVYCDSPPILESGRTLVPLRALCEALGYNVVWEDSSQTVYILDHFSGATVMDFKVNSTMAFVAQGDSGYTIYMDVPARMVNNRVLVPARAVAEALGFAVSWDESSKTVLIKSQG